METDRLRSKRDAIEPYVTLDGSAVRELMHPDHHGVAALSVAEAVVAAGAATRRHRHRRAEEVYLVTSGVGTMELGSESFAVAAGDAVAIPPEMPHRLQNRGSEPLVVLCCCAPAYHHDDTEVLE